jgi:hypothetical protein
MTRRAEKTVSGVEKFPFGLRRRVSYKREWGNPDGTIFWSDFIQ